MAARLVAQIRSMNPPGRFLKEDSENPGMYVEIGDQKAWKSECSSFPVYSQECDNFDFLLKMFFYSFRSRTGFA